MHGGGGGKDICMKPVGEKEVHPGVETCIGTNGRTVSKLLATVTMPIHREAVFLVHWIKAGSNPSNGIGFPNDS